MIISFIVPLYNCGPYIARCLDSLLDQGLRSRDFEIIVVNDGSTDNGRDIVCDYSLQHPEIRLIDQENQGVGAARNKGIDCAAGDYITFVDADDYLTSGGTGMLFGKLEKLQDIIAFEHIRTSQNFASTPLYFNILYNGAMKNYVFNNPFYGFCFGFFFKRELISKLKFDDIVMGEDTLFMLRMMNMVNVHVVKFDTKLYVYFNREGSASTRKDKAHMQKVMNAFIAIANILKNEDVLSNYSYQEKHLLTLWNVNYSAFMRLINSSFSLGETRRILRDGRNAGLFPFPLCPYRSFKLFSFLSVHPILTWITSLLYRNMYIPLIKNMR